MPASPARKRLRQQQREEEARRQALQQAEAAADTPRPTAPPRPLDGAPQEIDFLVPPGGLLPPEGAPPLAEKAKTVRVPGPMALYVGIFQNRHGSKRFSFIKVTLALWRLLLREEHQAVELARKAAAETGLPAQPKMGPLYRKVVAEMEEMRREGVE